MKSKIYLKLIHSRQWQALRASVLSAHPLCAACENAGRVRLASEVHHVIPVDSAASSSAKHRLMFDRSNLRPLCHDCHVEAHKSLGRNSKQANRERISLEVQNFHKKYLEDSPESG